MHNNNPLTGTIRTLIIPEPINDVRARRIPFGVTQQKSSDRVKESKKKKKREKQTKIRPICTQWESGRLNRFRGYKSRV